MDNLFEIKQLKFKKSEFLDNINEFSDIIPIIQDYSQKLDYDEIECVGSNDCCNKTNKNYFVEIQGFINEEDEFIKVDEVTEEDKKNKLDLFIIRIYKCLECKRWIIDILE